MKTHLTATLCIVLCRMRHGWRVWPQRAGVRGSRGAFCAQAVLLCMSLVTLVIPLVCSCLCAYKTSATTVTATVLPSAHPLLSDN